MQVTTHPVILLKGRLFVVALGNPYKTSGKLPGRMCSRNRMEYS